MTYTVRNFQFEDLELLKAFFKNDANKHLGYLPHEFTVEDILSKIKTHSLLLFANEDPVMLLGYAEFQVYPNINAISSDCWLNWLNFHYNIDFPIASTNTLFFNLYVYLPTENNALDMVFTEIFLRQPKIQYILTIKPPTLQFRHSKLDYSVLEKYSVAYHPKEFNAEACSNLQTVFLTLRDEILPEIKFRKARPGDNNEIIDIIDYEQPELLEHLGNFYIAEQLLLPNNNARNEVLIIAETIGKQTEIQSSGFFRLSTEYNLRSLIQNYHLESFGNLLTYDTSKHYKQLKLEVPSAVLKPEDQLFHTFEVRDMKGETNSSSTESSTSNINAGTSDEIEQQKCKKREQLFRKLRFIFEELRNPCHYVELNIEKITLKFNVPWTKNLRNVLMADASKAFVLKQINLHPNQREETLFNFLCAVFRVYPERDYCLFLLEPDQKINKSLKNMLKYFMRVPPRPKREMNRKVYILSRCSLYGDLLLFALSKYDVDDIKNIMFKTSDITDIYQQYLQWVAVYELIEEVIFNPSTEITFLTIRCGRPDMSHHNTGFVGFVILRPFLDDRQLYREYNLPHKADQPQCKRAEIVALKLHPFFHIWSDELFRHLNILTEFDDFYYVPLTEVKQQQLILPNDITKNMMPIEPRRLKKNWFIDPGKSTCSFKAADNPMQLDQNSSNDSLTIFRHGSLPTNLFVNQTAIVIIGLNELTKAFLRSLIFNWNGLNSTLPLQYNCVPILNVTVICDYGVVEAEYDKIFKCDYCYSRMECYINASNHSPFVFDTTRRMDLRHWVHFVSGTVGDIDRTTRTVNLTNGSRVYYNTLLLLCHVNYSLKALVDQHCVQPHNYAQLNTRFDKIELYHKVQEIVELGASETIVVYGANIGTYECINFLLNHGVKASMLTLVVPERTCKSLKYNNPSSDEFIEDISLKMAKDLNVTVLMANYCSFTKHPLGNLITSVNFKDDTTHKEFTLPCDFFISFYEDHMLSSTAEVLNAAEVELHNSYIVINANYRTNDPHIYAMGKHVNMSSDPTYQYTNTSDLEAAEKLLHILGLDIKKKDQPVAKPDIRYSKPHQFRASLLKGYYYVKITVPKRFLYSQTNHPSNQKVLATDDEDICRVTCNHGNIVETIVILTQKSLKLYHLEFFCGKHESLLNNMILRYDCGYIDNFIDFFNETWTEELMHDDFEELQAENKATLTRSLHRHRKDFVNNIALPEGRATP